MKKLFPVLLFSLFFVQLSAQYAGGKIKIYFNRPVDNALAGHYPAVFLNQTWADTLCAYINRAQYTIDVAQYDYSSSSTVSNIATAINNAYNRGVKVRWIYNGSSPNSALSSLNSGISKVASPTGSSYGIMHHKFVTIDANAVNPALSYVWTGSCDWSQEMVDSDYNNIIIFQDQPLAQAYTAQFNQMWGGTGVTPVPASEKFGPYKADLGPHIFNIGGTTVELYFSPTDSSNNRILSAIASANQQLYFGVYDFTMNNDASAIVAKYNAGLSVGGVVDQYTTTGGSAYTALSSGLGSKLRVYTQSYSLYHNKYVVIDPCDTASDPLVLTGSSNWTSSANSYNDENMVIIHNADVANIYYQAWYADFNKFGGTIASCQASSSCTGMITMNITANSQVSCPGGNNGSATVHAHGPHGPFHYSWSSTPVQTDSVLNNVVAGTYYVTVSDANGCSAFSSVTINQPAPMQLTVSGTDPTNGRHNGIAGLVGLNGARSPYTIAWSNGETGASDTGLGPGIYVVTVTDSAGCAATDTVNLVNVTTGISAVENAPSFIIKPNPARDILTVEDIDYMMGDQIIIRNMLGQPILVRDAAMPSVIVNLSELAEGVYLVEMQGKGKAGLCKLLISR